MKKFINIFFIIIFASILESQNLGINLSFSPGILINNWQFNDFAHQELRRYEFEYSQFSQPNKKSGETYFAKIFEIEPYLKLEEYLILALNFNITPLPVDDFKVESPDLSFIRKCNLSGNAFSFGFTEYYLLPLDEKINFKFGVGGCYSIANLNYSKESTSSGYYQKIFDYSFKGNGFNYFLKFLIDYKILNFLKFNFGLKFLFGSLTNFSFKDNSGNDITLYSFYLPDGFHWEPVI